MRSLRQKLSTMLILARRFGAGALGITVIDRIGKRFVGLEVTHIVWLEANRSSLPELGGDCFHGRFLTAEDVRHWATDESYVLDPDLADCVTAGTSRCYGLFDGERLAAYGFYGFSDYDPRNIFGVAFHVPPHAAYMYNGFTHPDYRGLKLHAIGMGQALGQLTDDGITALVSTVDWTNFASLRSCRRLGFDDLGRAITANIVGHCYHRFPPAAREHGLTFPAEAATDRVVPSLSQPAHDSA